MNKGRFILFCILILSKVFGNINQDYQLSKEKSSRNSPRNLRDTDYIIVNYASDFSSKNVDFTSQNSENKISAISTGNSIDSLTPVENINSVTINPNSILKIEFSQPLTTLAKFFMKMIEIKSIDFSHFISTEVTDMSQLFSGCNSTETITFGDNFNTEKVTKMNGMFYGCSSLIEIDLSKFITDSVTDMNEMFLFCTKLTEINLETFNTANVINFERMFSQCLLVKSLDLSSFNTGKTTNIGSMFSGCNSLTSINFGNDFNTESVISMSSMFMNCVNLKSLDLSQFITTSVTDMSYMFEGCSSLEVLDISNFDLTKVVVDIDKSSNINIFTNASNLRYSPDHL